MESERPSPLITVVAGQGSPVGSRLPSIRACAGVVGRVETARRIGTKIVVMVWEDGGYVLISWKQLNEFGRSTPLSFENPDFPAARTLTPLVVQTDASDPLFRKEHYGPVAFLIRCESEEDALAHASRDAGQHGSIANYVYSRDPGFRARLPCLRR